MRGSTTMAASVISPALLFRLVVLISLPSGAVKDVQVIQGIVQLVYKIFFVICSIFISVPIVIARTPPLLSLNNIISIIVLIPRVTLLSLDIYLLPSSSLLLSSSWITLLLFLCLVATFGLGGLSES